MTAYASFQIVIPVYNDWESVRQLLPLIGEQLEKANLCADLLLVDDGSDQMSPRTWEPAGKSIKTIRILRLRRNLGHQRAICIGLCHLQEHSQCTRVLVMDGDGEDDPADIPRLVSELEQNERVRIVFAERRKRSEGWVFSLFYAIYRLLHRLLVGHRVRVGNYSVMRRECLESLCTSPEMWNHFAASAFATRQSMAMVPSSRTSRLAGDSKMKFPALVMHGLSALSVFSDRISTRLLILSAVVTVVTVLGMLAVTLIRLTTDLAIPGWATSAFGILLLLLVQVGTFMFTFSFLVLFARGMSPFIPARDYQYFVLQNAEVIDVSDS